MVSTIAGKKVNDATSGFMRPLVVVGSVNADIYVELDRLPKPGETVSAKSGSTLPGGKGANQAACGARLGHPTYFVGQVGRDSYAELAREALTACGVRLEYLGSVAGPTGHAVVMLQPGGQNSIVIVGGANMAWPRLDDGITRLPPGAQQVIRRAGALLLQREVPDALNLEAAKIARAASVPVVLDAGGADAPIGEELLRLVTVLSPNETELARLTGLPTGSPEEILAAAHKLQERGVGQVLVKLGEQGCMLVTREGPPLVQACVRAPHVVDTTGAGDTFTAAYAMAIIQGSTLSQALLFASAAASLCVRAKGAMPSMPTREAVHELLQEAET
eukprot:jgi/Mesen1/9344/ME000061S08790